MSQIPLNAAASNGDNNRQVTSSLPQEVVQCLENARFLHLATCRNNVPNVSLMNYTYLPSSSSPYAPPGWSPPLIVMTTNPASKKMANLAANANVSLLVHDWVSHRPPTTSGRRRSSSSSSRRMSGGTTNTTAAAAAAASVVSPSRSSLASLLLNLNTSAMSSISATINGRATVLEAGSAEELFYRRAHLDNNTFVDTGPTRLGRPAGGGGGGGGADDDGRECFVAGEEVRVIVVRVRDVRISDWKGNVRDWVLADPAEADGARQAVANGVS